MIGGIRYGSRLFAILYYNEQSDVFTSFDMEVRDE